jgi:hypothetical protein
MKNLYVFFVIALFFDIAGAQDSTISNPRESTFGVTFTMENAFGYYPTFYGNLGLTSNLDLTFYGVMWTNPSFGLPQTTFSSDLLIENSIGIGFNAFDDQVYVSPSIGFIHGKFLSGGDESVAFEGIVPSLSLYINPGSVDTEVYFSFYRHLRDEVTDPINRSTANMIFYWFTPGVWVSKSVSIGMHYEGLFLKFGTGDFESSYQWLGPYIKLRTKNKYDFRFMAGPNLKEGVYANEFYKLVTNIPLN